MLYEQREQSKDMILNFRKTLKQIILDYRSINLSCLHLMCLIKSLRYFYVVDGKE